MLLLAQDAQVNEGWATSTIAILVVALLVIIVFLSLIAQFINLYIQAWVSGARVSMIDLIGMRLRKVNARVIVEGSSNM